MKGDVLGYACRVRGFASGGAGADSWEGNDAVGVDGRGTCGGAVGAAAVDVACRVVERNDTAAARELGGGDTYNPKKLSRGKGPDLVFILFNPNDGAIMGDTKAAGSAAPNADADDFFVVELTYFAGVSS
ncbi:hypothetical protein D8674_010922 [Pyrus ussuriensis x Pyrus communis]|uniref:Uncharacterized protein n=1 Tax=Pyrus ussuriensis x Pyrus communis TaxID=2448454 RepID=A0A5N5GAP7_9ROSA|nr:hypothetical protein D8674_010922 [Pyrus ussuriensis x Pyrus communis]